MKDEKIRPGNEVEANIGQRKSPAGIPVDTVTEDRTPGAIQAPNHQIDHQ